ncbi:TPA: hypothetical protein P0E04_003770 [Vibrio campbellii]|nr:hypothetical protein [Vibrio campbellii]
MAISLKLLVREYPIPCAIRTASGTISSKPEILIAFAVNDQLRFAMEFPLSPSAGESLASLKLRFNEYTFVDSPHIQNAISYFANLHYRAFELTPSQTSSTYQTVGITQNGDWKPGADYVKLKTSPHHLDHLKEFLNFHRSKAKFVLDFNASIQHTDFASTLKLLEDVDYFAIEQPLNVNCDMNVGYADPHVFIADESLPQLTYPELTKHGFSGFVFKAFRNNYSALRNCSVNREQLFGVIGTNMSGPFDVQLSALLNDYMPIRVSNYSLQSFFELHPLEHMAIYQVEEGRVMLTTEAIDYLSRAPEVAKFSLPISQLEAKYDKS